MSNADPLTLLSRILQESGAQVFAEPGGQPAVLSATVALRINRDEAALVETLLAEGEPHS